ncbi:MAG: hypothetical protein V4615_17855 [Bacteroidota bacterium]
MKTNLFLLLAVAALLFNSCNNKEETATVQPAAGTELTATPPSSTTINMISSDSNATLIPVGPGEKTVTAKGMNPPHGEPGHRCDIEVGAPLSSPPGKAPAAPSASPASGSAFGSLPLPGASTTPTSPSAPSLTTTPSGPTPAGMNPPHGQPGHDCAIAVGAPLKKK